MGKRKSPNNVGLGQKKKEKKSNANNSGLFLILELNSIFISSTRAPIRYAHFQWRHRHRDLWPVFGAA